MTIALGDEDGQRRLWLGSLFAALGALGFAAKAILIKLAYRIAPIDSTTILALRVLLSVPAFLLMAWHGGGDSLSRRDKWMLVWLGFTGYYLASFFDFWGLQFVTAALERLILFTYPGLVLLFNALIYKKKIGLKEYGALLLSWLGIGLVFSHDIASSPQPDAVWKGAGLVFLSSITYALYLIGSSQVIHRIGTVRLTGIVVSVAAGFIVAHFSLTHPLGDLIQPTPIYWLALALAIFSTILPIYFTSEGIKRLGANRVSIVASIGPVFTIWLGYLFLNEPVSATQLSGTGLVLAGVLLVSMR
ncbi:DMT family transporter [Bryobacter aggregatus]|uniref:DMT family transporter n=1 Tax=Bryobacter aggregatus TaxID=360054 RepID=UPI000690B7A7|nr:DMT family transporter [Bryobacter aggregatus]